MDIITFGSPCQDMSIAGKEEILDGSRSSLFYEAIRIVKEMRCKDQWRKTKIYRVGECARPSHQTKGRTSKQSSKPSSVLKNRPPRCLHLRRKDGPMLTTTWETDGASRIEFLMHNGGGVPQRRKRIYLVADFADQSAPKVLFESEGVSRYSAEGFRAWQRAAAGAESGTGEAGFSGAGGRICLNDQGGEQMDVTQDVTSHPPGRGMDIRRVFWKLPVSVPEHSADARSIGYEEERSPTLRAGVVPAAIALENHPADSRVKISEDGKVQTLTSRCGTGGGNVPMVMDAVENSVESPVKDVENSPAVTLKIRSGCEGGGKGSHLAGRKICHTRLQQRPDAVRSEMLWCLLQSQPLHDVRQSA